MNNARIESAPTAITAFVGENQHVVDDAVRDFVDHGGTQQVTLPALDALADVDLFNLLCVLPDTTAGDVSPETWQAALRVCVQRRAMLIVDPPAAWTDAATAAASVGDLGLTGDDARNAALYFPRATDRVACGAIAGVIARTDATRGVWKAPAGVEATLGFELQHPLTNDDSGRLNVAGINGLRLFPVYGTVIWGARTMRGADAFADDYKYIPVRRLALNIEESLLRGLAWTVWQPNDMQLWSQIRQSAETFLTDLWRQGAFAGAKPNEAFFVRCDETTTTGADIEQGIVNVTIGFAPARPAEFIILDIRLLAASL